MVYKKPDIINVNRKSFELLFAAGVADRIPLDPAGPEEY